MVKLKIQKILKYNAYVLKDNEKEVQMILEFYGLKPTVGNTLMISEKLLDKSFFDYSQPYSFQPTTEIGLNDITHFQNEEYAVLFTKEKTFILKRIYG